MQTRKAQIRGLNRMFHFLQKQGIKKDTLEKAMREVSPKAMEKLGQEFGPERQIQQGTSPRAQTEFGESGCSDKGSLCKERAGYCKYAANGRRRGYGGYCRDNCQLTCKLCTPSTPSKTS